MPAVPPARLGPCARLRYSPERRGGLRLAAERRGPRRLRDLRLRAQGRDPEPGAGDAGARQPPEDAAPRRQRRRRGRRLRYLSTSRARSGPRRSARRPQPGARPRRRLRGRPRLHRALPGPRAGAAGGREILGRAASASSPSASGRSTRRPWRDCPRGGAALLADRGLAPTPSSRHVFDLMIELEAELGSTSPRSRQRPASTRRWARRRSSASTTRTFATSASRRSAASATTATRPTPGLVQARAAVLGARPRRRDQHDRSAGPEAKMLGRSTPAPPTSRTWPAIDTLIRRRGSPSPRRWR